MGQHLADEHRSFLVPNPRGQAIAAHVEDHQPTYLVGGRERISYLLKSCPRRRLHHLVPTSQRPLRLGMCLPKLSERPTADYPHSGSTLRISRSSYYIITSHIAKSCVAQTFGSFPALTQSGANPIAPEGASQVRRTPPEACRRWVARGGRAGQKWCLHLPEPVGPVRGASSRVENPSTLYCQHIYRPSEADRGDSQPAFPALEGTVLRVPCMPPRRRRGFWRSSVRSSQPPSSSFGCGGGQPAATRRAPPDGYA